MDYTFFYGCREAIRQMREAGMNEAIISTVVEDIFFSAQRMIRSEFNKCFLESFINDSGWPAINKLIAEYCPKE